MDKLEEDWNRLNRAFENLLAEEFFQVVMFDMMLRRCICLPWSCNFAISINFSSSIARNDTQLTLLQNELEKRDRAHYFNTLCILGELQQRWPWLQQEKQKHVFMYICHHCTTTTWKCLISCCVQDRNTRQELYFSCLELWYGPVEFNSKKICWHLTN